MQRSNELIVKSEGLLDGIDSERVGSVKHWCDDEAI